MNSVHLTGAWTFKLRMRNTINGFSPWSWSKITIRWLNVWILTNVTSHLKHNISGRSTWTSKSGRGCCLWTIFFSICSLMLIFCFGYRSTCSIKSKKHIKWSLCSYSFYLFASSRGQKLRRNIEFRFDKAVCYQFMHAERVVFFRDHHTMYLKQLAFVNSTSDDSILFAIKNLNARYTYRATFRGINRFILWIFTYKFHGLNWIQLYN